MTEKRCEDDHVLEEYEAGFVDWLGEVDERLVKITEGLNTTSFPRFSAQRAYCIGLTIDEAVEQCLSTSKTGRLFLQGF